MAFLSRLRAPLTAAAITALLTGGAAYAVEVTKPAEDTTTIAVKTNESAVTIEPSFVLRRGDENPSDFPGIRGDRRGGPIAKGAAIVGYRVTVTTGKELLFPSFQMRCPDRKRFVTMSAEGDVGMQLVGRNPFTRRSYKGGGYIGKRDYAVIIDYQKRDITPGETLKGTIYGYCR